ncbi:hypothetical protein J2752_002296 [Halarchaeum rubridurum]|uniref:DUF7322 domain-containing protein n=1 Tax=Halarchaeum rubridurum TaxID=489911 RepID=A0A830G218_9EURY|nr:hypothetical protein [Halarchaeum rubridurum]MBP1955373.1 hypothetical protein [Halarchaeum rubridurum]GGM71853.1 hypothetical protein GCM10009017_22260 [Halarchaeum rubridurum]
MFDSLKPESADDGDVEDAEADEESPDVDLSDPLQRQFVYLVVVFNLAILAAALGLMFLYFRGRLLLGGGLAAVGFAGLAYGFVTYRRVQRAIDAGEHDEPADDANGDAE